MQIHATVISVDGNGVIFRGPSGSGKSDLALRMIGDGAILVADDRCNITIINGTVYATAPNEISGLLEVRGIGVFRLKCLTSVPVALVFDLARRDDIERLPRPATCSDLGTDIPCVRLAPFEASAPDKIRMALRGVLGKVESVS